MQGVVVDVDGHVAEPITEIMEQYLDPAFRDRPLRLLNDENGLEYLEINGRSRRLYRGARAWVSTRARPLGPMTTSLSSPRAESTTTME